MRIFKIRNVKTPTRGTNMSAGIDLYIPEDFYIKRGDTLHPAPLYDKGTGSFKIEPGKSVLIPSGIKINVPKDRALIAFNKSGVAVNKNLIVGACVIDEDYTGEIHIDVKNVGSESTWIQAGDKIIQLICMPVDYVNIEECNSELECFGDTLVLSERGEGGFGSTGTK
jgi:dUTP pyrophosphatase